MAQSPLTLVQENGVGGVGGIISGKSFLSVLLGVFLNWSVGQWSPRYVSNVAMQCRARLGACRTLPDLSPS